MCPMWRVAAKPGWPVVGQLRVPQIEVASKMPIDGDDATTGDRKDRDASHGVTGTVVSFR